MRAHAPLGEMLRAVFDPIMASVLNRLSELGAT